MRQDAVGDLLQQDRLAGARRGDDQAALALADRRDQVDDAHVDLVAGRSPAGAGPVGVQRRQVVEDDLLAQHVRVLVVDRLDAQQGEVALVLLGRPDLAGDDRAGPQAEAADLAGRDVDVVGAGEVVVVGAAEEAEAVGQDLERALAEHQAVLLDPLLEDLEDQVLLLQAGVLGEALGLGRAEELRHRHLLQLGDVGLAALDLLVAVVDRGVAEDVLVVVVGELRRGRRRRSARRAGGAPATGSRSRSRSRAIRGAVAYGRDRRSRSRSRAARRRVSGRGRRGRRSRSRLAVAIAVAVGRRTVAVAPIAGEPLADAAGRAFALAAARGPARDSRSSRSRKRIGSRSAGRSSRYGSRSSAVAVVVAAGAGVDRGSEGRGGGEHVARGRSSSARSEAGAGRAALRMRDVPEDSRRGRVSLAMAIDSPRSIGNGSASFSQARAGPTATVRAGDAQPDGPGQASRRGRSR